MSICVIWTRPNQKGLTSAHFIRMRVDFKIVHEMDISVNTSKVKDTNNEPLVTDNSVIKSSLYLNYSSAVKSSSTTWKRRMNARTWKMQRISIGQKYMIP